MNTDIATYAIQPLRKTCVKVAEDQRGKLGDADLVRVVYCRGKRRAVPGKERNGTASRRKANCVTTIGGGVRDRYVLARKHTVPDLKSGQEGKHEK